MRCEKCGRFVAQPQGETLAKAHWAWLEELFSNLTETANKEMRWTRFIYLSAFVHGFRHGQEIAQNNKEKTIIT